MCWQCVGWMNTFRCLILIVASLFSTCVLWRGKHCLPTGKTVPFLYVPGLTLFYRLQSGPLLAFFPVMWWDRVFGTCLSNWISAARAPCRFVAAFWTLSKRWISFDRWGDQAWTQYSILFERIRFRQRMRPPPALLRHRSQPARSSSLQHLHRRPVCRHTLWRYFEQWQQRQQQQQPPPAAPWCWYRTHWPRSSVDCQPSISDIHRIMEQHRFQPKCVCVCASVCWDMKCSILVAEVSSFRYM